MGDARLAELERNMRYKERLNRESGGDFTFGLLTGGFTCWNAYMAYQYAKEGDFSALFFLHSAFAGVMGYLSARSFWKAVHPERHFSMARFEEEEE
jgi:hypothetical protein